MKEEREDTGGQRSWFDRLSAALLGEPENRDELVSLLRDAQQRGLLDLDALAMMEGVLQVTEMQVRDIMIPRAQMMVLEADWPVERLLAESVASGHSRFPVIGENRDDVLGILLVKDLLRYFTEGAETFHLRDVLRPAQYIPEAKRLNTLLKEFRNSRLHMAIVVDEYGGVAGLVTIEDVLEQIVGEIDDEHDAEDEGDIRELPEGDFIIKALTPVEDFNEHFKSRLDEEKADTVGGLVMMALGRLPKRGEEVDLQGFRFRVLRADNRRVHLLGMQRLTEPEADADEPPPEEH